MINIHIEERGRVEGSNKWMIYICLPVNLIYLCRIWSRSLCKQEKQQLKNTSNTIYLCWDRPSLNLLRAALHHTGVTPAAKLAFTSISLTRWPSPGTVGGIILACYQTKHPAMQSPSSYSTTQQLEFHFSECSKPPTPLSSTIRLLRVSSGLHLSVCVLETSTQK